MPRAMPALALLAALPLCAAAAAAVAPAPATPSDTGFASYAFASELGSGIYAVDGRTIQVYQLSPSYLLRPPAPHGGRPGIRLILPITAGFFNFQPIDLVHGQLPSSIGALSLEPGVQLDYHINDAWDIYPYVKGGGTFASSAEINAVIFGTGVRSDYRFEAFDTDDLWRAELAYAGVHYPGNLPNDSFTRLRDGLELRRTLDWIWRGREPQIAPYLLADIYFNAPSGPQSGISARTLQFEAGLMLSVTPMWDFHGVSLPRLGIGYREAGVLSGWRLVIGEPF
ncbi:MAG: hypothetical protein WA747_16520 [Steroidobacteraceae bacterium]